MHPQHVEVAAEGTPPVASVGRVRLDQFSTAGRGFGTRSKQIQLVYPVRNKEKVKAEEKQIQELEAPLKEKVEGAHLKRKLETPQDEHRVVTEVIPSTQIAKASSRVVSNNGEACPISPKTAGKKKKREKLV
jgi:hypothetical protein